MSYDEYGRWRRQEYISSVTSTSCTVWGGGMEEIPTILHSKPALLRCAYCGSRTRKEQCPGCGSRDLS